MKQYLVPALGVVAFVIGGIVTRSKALDAVETLEREYNKHKKPIESPVE